MFREKETIIEDLQTKLATTAAENSSLQEDLQPKEKPDRISSDSSNPYSSVPPGDKRFKDRSELSEKVAKLEQKLSEKDEELATMRRTVAEARSSKGQIFEDVQMLEENLADMQDTIQTLRRQLAEKSKEIESLEYELNCSRQESKNIQDLVETRRKNGEVISGLKEKEREMDGQLELLTGNLRSVKQENRDLALRLVSLEKEKQALTDTSDRFRLQVAELSAELKLALDKTKRVREDTQQEMMTRIITLKQEKLDLAARLEELQDFIDIQKRSVLEAPSLMDELSQLEEVSSPKPMRLSPAIDSKQLEGLKVDLVRTR